MIIYGVLSSRTRRCLWTLEEAHADYTLKSVNLLEGDHLHPDYLELNPNGRVPVMDDDGFILFESAAICQYIARKYPEAELLPEPSSRDAALHDQWLFWVVTELEQALWSMGKHRFALPEKHRIPAMQETAAFEWKRAAAVIASALKGREYVLGQKMRVVDIVLAHTLLWGRGFKAPFESDVLEAYLDKMIGRPAFERTRRHG